MEFNGRETDVIRILVMEKLDFVEERINVCKESDNELLKVALIDWTKKKNELLDLKTKILF